MEQDKCPACDDALADIPYEEMCDWCQEGYIDSKASVAYEEAAYGYDE